MPSERHVFIAVRRRDEARRAPGPRAGFPMNSVDPAHLPLEPYDQFAWFYDLHWAKIFARNALQAVETLILPYVPVRGSLLDLCCGAGHLAAALSDRGYRVTGVDRSGEMLVRAKRKAARALWVRADARRFALRSVHHGAVSLFDSLNHVLDPEGLASAIRNVRGALRDGAPFLFDLNAEAAFRERWVNEHQVATRQGICRLTGAYDPEERLGRYRVTLEGRGRETWRQAEFELVERCHTEQEVRFALAAAGFGDVEIYDAEEDFDMPGEVGRLFYLARACASPFAASGRPGASP